MSFHSFFAWIRATCRGSTPLEVEEGVVISTRLRELRSVTKCNPSEKSPTQAQDEDDEDKKNRDKFGT
jgi:hypothetical protein